MKNFLIIFITMAFLCSYTGISQQLLSNSKVSMLCDSENCESENIENQQLMEDDHIIGFVMDGFSHFYSVPNTFSPFHYGISFNLEIYRTLLYPPPELG